MLSLRNRFGVAGIASVMALAFALVVGGAYAAENSGDGATASAKNRKGGGNVNKLIKREARKFSKVFSQRFSKRFPGPIGPRGFPGLPGAPGEDGDDGDDGDDGSDGQNGKEGKQGPAGDSVVSNSFDGESEPGSEPCEGAGGTEFEVEGSGEVEFVCNGSGGAGGGLPATLPSGATQTGSWAISIYHIAEQFPISFPIPLENPIAGSNAVIVEEGEEGELGECSDAAETTKGTAANPLAAPGYLCVYVTHFQTTEAELTEIKRSSTFPDSPGASETGAIVGALSFAAEDGGFGTWAVTAP